MARQAREPTGSAPVRDFAVDAMMELIRDDLAALGVRHDVFISERALVAKPARSTRRSTTLDERGLIYTGVLEPPKGKTPDDWEPRPQTLFRATQFGDDVDRPLQEIRRLAGPISPPTSPITYDKFRRGFTSLIDVWGADHGGYVKRMQAAVKALTDGKVRARREAVPARARCCDNGEPVRMSKRAGTFVTLRDVIDEVGKDVVRFIMLTRKNDAQLDFDLAKVIEQSKRQPGLLRAVRPCARAARCCASGRGMFPDVDLTTTALAAAPI